ncbi:MAG: S8 family serine peptidase [Promethearchaeota archaeon]|nr:MAG: S8 family serine peptidase [Candidatus Lokiarchaeota archaeon]
MKIYPPFKKKLENHSNDKHFKVLISFENLSNREKFLEKYQDLKILKKFDFLPLININLMKEQIINFEEEILINQIEEDQKLYLSMLDVLEILELDEYKNSQISYDGNNINVGIIDNGINKNFPSIPNSKNYNDVKINKQEVSHGTIIAGIICNQFKNLYDNFIGIAPKVNLIDFKLSYDNNEYNFSSILEILEKIDKEKIDVDILLISLATSEASDGKDILSLACDLLIDDGLIIVSPAGNFGPEKNSIGSPGASAKVITIGGLTKEFKIPDYSGRGPTLDNRVKPDLCLPSSDIILPLSENLRVKVTGTSVAASIGVGIIALIKEYDKNLTYNEILDLMKKVRLDLNYEPTSQGFGTIKVTDLFEELDLYHQQLIPYNYLIKKSIKVAIEIFIVLIFLFYIILFFRMV